MKNINKAIVIVILSALSAIICAISHKISNNYIRILIPILVILLGVIIMCVGIEIINDCTKR